MHGRFGYVLVGGALLALAAGVFSCGSDEIGSSGGSWGEGDTNTMVLMELNPASIEVDICNAVSIGLVANITAQQINTALPPNSLRVEGYEVVFMPNSAGTPDIQGGEYELTSEVPVSDLDLFFMDPGLKSAFLNDINSGLYAGMQAFPSYSARYIVYGTDSFNNTPRVWGAKASFSFKIDRYTTCVPSIVPAAVTKTAKYNPDLDPSDDITFNISGGTAPYSVISNSIYIESPGNLGIGEMSFTVDPDKPDIIRTVTLTVTDAKGQEVQAVIAIN